MLYTSGDDVNLRVIFVLPLSTVPDGGLMDRIPEDGAGDMPPEDT